MMDKEFRAEIDRALPLLGYSDRSAFIRDSVYKALAEFGISLPGSLAKAPQRTGKGGRKKSDQSVDMRGVNHGTITITQKKKSTSTLPARGRKGAAGSAKKKAE